MWVDLCARASLSGRPCLAPSLLGVLLAALNVHVRLVQGVPVGTITALATQTRNYTEQVHMTYFEPVNCSLDFNEDIVGFGPLFIDKGSKDTQIMHLVKISERKFEFQVSSLVNENVSIYIPALTVKNLHGEYNNESTAHYSVEFYAYPPAVTLRLDGFEGATTSQRRNVAYLQFNSTTRYDDQTQWFGESHVSFSPHLDIADFWQVNDMMFRFSFQVPLNESVAAEAVDCVNSTADVDGVTHFPCNLCRRPQLCASESTYPPKNIAHMEFPFLLLLKAVPDLGMDTTSLLMIYDTLWATVSMDAPAYAQDAFFVTITWSEPLFDLASVQPTFDPKGPPVDQDILRRNLTVLNASSIRLLIAPTRTGIVTMSINGTEATSDLAGNSNDFRRIPESRTGALRVIVFSAGPPMPGNIEFSYERPRFYGEYLGTGVSSEAIDTNALTVSWKDFTTATSYDMWVTWGHNMSWPETRNLAAEKFRIVGIKVSLGVEYTVYVRAWNVWGQATTVTRVFLHPEVAIVADGTHSIVALPSVMSPAQTDVGFHVLIPEGGFLTMNPLKVLAIRSAERMDGDPDACLANTQLSRCTYVNFHIEVPYTQFVVFRQPVRLQFKFGPEGWEDAYSRPELRYWEPYYEEWRSVVETCPAEQVLDRWNKEHRIYEISVCHLSQFAVFEQFAPPQTTTASPTLSRAASYDNPTFFVVLGGVVVAAALMCCLCYWVFVRSMAIGRRPLAYGKMGIKPVTERLPSRRLGSGFEVLALPACDAVQPQPQLALQDDVAQLIPGPSRGAQAAGATWAAPLRPAAAEARPREEIADESPEVNLRAGLGIPDPTSLPNM